MEIVELEQRPKRTRALSERVNRKYWADVIDITKMRGAMWDSPAEFIESLGHCYVCGYKAKLEKCHILAYQYGGHSNHDNIHFLCKFCHVISEGITGNQYWDWFYNPQKRLLLLLEKYGYDLDDIQNFSYSVLASFVSNQSFWLDRPKTKTKLNKRRKPIIKVYKEK